jgi:hypothetical protein
LVVSGRIRRPRTRSRKAWNMYRELVPKGLNESSPVRQRPGKIGRLTRAELAFKKATRPGRDTEQEATETDF